MKCSSQRSNVPEVTSKNLIFRKCISFHLISALGCHKRHNIYVKPYTFTMLKTSCSPTWNAFYALQKATEPGGISTCLELLVRESSCYWLRTVKGVELGEYVKDIIAINWFAYQTLAF